MFWIRLLFWLTAGVVTAPLACAAEPPVQTGTASDSDAGFPLPAEEFARGNVPPARTDLNASAPARPADAGFYFATGKLLVLLGLFCLWLFLTRFVFDDACDRNMRPAYWSSWMLAGGLAALLLILIIPYFPLGLIAAGVSLLGPMTLYILQRNQKVPENRRLLTPGHFLRWGRYQLSRIGLSFGPKSVALTASGPPVVFIGKTRTGQRDMERSRQVEMSRGYRAAKELVYDAVMRQATDIHLEPQDEDLMVRLRIDGVMYAAEPFDKPTGESIVNIIKVLCEMDITERRRPQDGSFGATVESRDVDFRAASQGTRHGEKLSIRILDQSNTVGKLSNLGLRKPLQAKLMEVVSQPHGMLLVSGPTGAGKSTTLYAALQEIDFYQRNVITIENPVEYKLEGVTQIEINSKGGTTFGQTLRSVLRQDPDVIMIGEIRDEETAKIACQAANTGHMVFSTVHANDAVTALYRILDLGVEPFMLSSAISAILAQRLARRLCPDCREAYRPSEDLLKTAGLSADRIDVFYRAAQNGSCSRCSGLGYLGRIGVFELLTVNDRMRELVREKSAVNALRNEARKDGMLYLREEGLRLIVRGVTSVDEIQRVVK